VNSRDNILELTIFTPDGKIVVVSEHRAILGPTWQRWQYIPEFSAFDLIDKHRTRLVGVIVNGEIVFGPRAAQNICQGVYGGFRIQLLLLNGTVVLASHKGMVFSVNVYCVFQTI
jgi:hypothetical protein